MKFPKFFSLPFSGTCVKMMKRLAVRRFTQLHTLFHTMLIFEPWNFSEQKIVSFTHLPRGGVLIQTRPKPIKDFHSYGS